MNNSYSDTSSALENIPIDFFSNKTIKYGICTCSGNEGPT